MGWFVLMCWFNYLDSLESTHQLIIWSWIVDDQRRFRLYDLTFFATFLFDYPYIFGCASLIIHIVCVFIHVFHSVSRSNRDLVFPFLVLTYRLICLFHFPFLFTIFPFRLFFLVFHLSRLHNPFIPLFFLIIKLLNPHDFHFESHHIIPMLLFHLS